MRPLLAAVFIFSIAPAAGQEVRVPDGFERSVLVLDPAAGRRGIYRIEPQNPGVFRGFTVVDLERVDAPVPDPRNWLLDRLATEAGEIAGSTFFLVDPDGPASGNGAQSVSPARTLRRIGTAPESFCAGPDRVHSLPGAFLELGCAFTFETFTAHLLLRLGRTEAGWFALRARALSAVRFRELVAIADSVRFGEGTE